MSEGRPTVGAIVPTYNRKALLAECLDSLLAQSRRPDRILVVDDGSEDGTDALVVERYAGIVEYLRKPNGGKSSALNLALERLGSSIDYVWICDDDDLAAPGACEAMADALERNPEADFVYGRYQLAYGQPGGPARLETPYGWPTAAQPDLFLAMMEQMFIQQFSSMVRRTVLDDIGPFRTELVRSQDYDMLLKIAHRGRGVALDQVVFLQRQHEGLRGSAKDRFDAASRYERWRAYDRIFFEEWRERLGVDGFAPAFARGWSKAPRERAALLQRAVIFGRRRLWDRAAEDWAGAADLGGDAEPSMEEIELVGRLAIDLEALKVLSRERGLAQRMGASRRRPYGRAILALLARPLPWLARQELLQRRPRSAWAILRLVVGLRAARVRNALPPG